MMNKLNKRTIPTPTGGAIGCQFGHHLRGKRQIARAGFLGSSLPAKEEQIHYQLLMDSRLR